MELDESNEIFYNIYSLVRNQIRVTPMGDVIDLDHRAVMYDIELYVDADKVKETFENILMCFSIEQEYLK